MAREPGLLVPTQATRRAGRAARELERHESAGGEARRVEEAILRRAGDEAALLAFLRHLSPSLRLTARLALGRLLGPDAGSATWRAAWNAEHPALSAATSTTEPAPQTTLGLRARLDWMRAVALGDVLDHPGIPWSA